MNTIWEKIFLSLYMLILTLIVLALLGGLVLGIVYVSQIQIQQNESGMVGC